MTGGQNTMTLQISRARSLFLRAQNTNFSGEVGVNILCLKIDPGQFSMGVKIPFDPAMPELNRKPILD